jgi:hypothetical protein
MYIQLALSYEEPKSWQLAKISKSGRHRRPPAPEKYGTGYPLRQLYTWRRAFRAELALLAFIGSSIGALTHDLGNLRNAHD